MDDAGPFRGAGFYQLYANDADGAAPSVVSDEPDEKAEFKANVGKWRGITTRLCRQGIFLAAVGVSKRVKQPLSHALLWIQKADKETNTATKAARDKGEEYLGATSLSLHVLQFVAQNSLGLMQSTSNISIFIKSKSKSR